jgi:ABC-type uncharacterized transport system substrate-binding protein
LREAKALALSLVAVVGEQLVGHIAFCEVGPNVLRGWFAIGPVSVNPSLQRRGVGQQLVESGLRDLRARGASDVVAGGLVASLSRPDGNLTGLEIVTTQLDAKRLEILKEALPTITTVALLWNPGSAAYNASNLADQRRGMEAAAQAVGVRLGMLEARDLRGIDTVFRTIQREDPGALLVGSDAIFTTGRQRIVELATQLRIPSMYGWREFVEVGGFMSYGTSLPDLYRRAATYVDKILKGAKPADLPVEQPTKFELVINLKTAKELGLKIPPPVLGRADQVIE